MAKRNTTHCVLYHANCYDGLGAAWAIRKQLGDTADYIPVQYGESPPDVTGKHVIIADFSFSPLVLRIMEEKAASLTLLDHHASAKDMLQDYQCLCPRTHIEFDMKRSGAMMAWNHFHPNQEPPLLLQHIQDQDLWNWEMPHSEAFLRNLSSYPMSMQTYDKVANFSSDEYEQFVRQGQGLVAQFNTFVSEFVNRALPVELDGIQGFHVATSHHFRNEVLRLPANATPSAFYGKSTPTASRSACAPWTNAMSKISRFDSGVVAIQPPHPSICHWNASPN